MNYRAKQLIESEMNEKSYNKGDTLKVLQPFKVKTTTSGKQPRTPAEIKDTSKFKEKLLILRKGSVVTFIGSHVTMGVLLSNEDGKEFIVTEKDFNRMFDDWEK